uniref:C-type lectin domain-containing protein n=2 Tax=Steinernema glaseri TaxID=37863 RepID=A0A1I8AIK9_9BILA
MRSFIGLLAALLVLPSCLLASITYEKVIACAILEKLENTPYIFVGDQSRAKAWSWSTDDSEFIDAYYFHGEDCGFESIAQLCRSSYNNVSYGKEMNETKTYHIEKFWYEKGNKEIETKNETLEAKLFKCQDYIRAEEPSVPKGSWSDRLSTAFAMRGKCKSEGDWKKTAKDECGTTPTHYNLGAKCGDRAEYLEIIFVCDAPNKNTIFEAREEFLEQREDYFHNSQFAVLQRYAELAEKLMEASAKNKTESVDIFERELTKVSVMVSHTINGAHKLTSLSTLQLNPELHELLSHDEHGYKSRENVFTRAKYAVRNIAIDRSTQLFHLAVTPLSNGSLENGSMGFMTYAFDDDMPGDLSKYDVENLLSIMDQHSGGLEDFPELKEPLMDYYVDCIKNHTLGIAPEHLDFLREPSAHARIAEMYEDIFNPGLIDKKYLDKPKSSSSYSFFWPCVIVAVVLALGAFYVRRHGIPRVGDVPIFRRFFNANDEEQLVEEGVSGVENPTFVAEVPGQA